MDINGENNHCILLFMDSEQDSVPPILLYPKKPYLMCSTLSTFYTLLLSILLETWVKDEIMI